MSRRKLSTPGMTYVEANGGRVSTYTLDTDVIEAHRRVQEAYPELRVLWDNDNQEHLIIEKCADGAECLVFATKNFHEEQIMERLAAADHTRTDPFTELEKYNEAVEAAQDYRLAEAMGDVGQRLAWAFNKDGLTHKPRIFIGKGIENK